MDLISFNEEAENKNSENNSNALVYGGFEDPKIIVSLGTLAAKIAYNNFEWRHVTLVLYNTMLHIGVESFLRYYDRSVYLKLGHWVPKHRVHVPQFVLFGQDIAEILDTLKWLVSAKYDNTGMYIIVCSSPIDEKCSQNELFQQISRSYFVNSIFLKSSKDGESSEMYTYYPILPNKCLNNKPVKLYLECENSSCYKNLYPEKLNDLQKCPLYISTLEQPPFMFLHNRTTDPSGGDGDVMTLVADILNATLIMTTPECNEYGHYENSNWTGSLGDVFNKRAHASMCSTPLTPQIYGNFQISFTYNSIDIVWVARLPMQKPTWEQLFYPLKSYVRIVLFFTFVLIICMNTFVNTRLWKNIATVLNLRYKNVSLFFYSWVIFFGVPLTKLPSKSALRIIVICWIWFCFIFRTAYQAILVSSLKLQLYEDYMKSFQEVLHNRYPYGGSSSLLSYYSEDPTISANWVRVKLAESYNVVDGLLDGTSNFVIAFNKESIIHYLMKYNGTKRLQILPEKIVNSPTVMYFKKFNPFRAPISRVLSLLMEGGFIDNIYAKYLDRSNYLFQHAKDEVVEPLTLLNTSTSFIILFVGWFISIIYFFIEVTCGKRDHTEQIAFKN